MEINLCIYFKNYFDSLCFFWIFIFITCNPVFSACTQSLNTEGIISDWVVNDKEYLNGRKDIFYYFEQENITYTLNIGGPIKVASDPFYNEEVTLGRNLIKKVDSYIGLDFFQVGKREDADLIILGVCVPDTDLEGIVTESLDGTQYIMTLNGCNSPFSERNPPETLFLHEFGHALGLEHPFDNTDGDCIGSTDPWSKGSAHTGHTLMAYRNPPGKVKTFFTELDIAALQVIWGLD